MMSDDDNPRDYTHEIPGLKRPDPDTLVFPMPAANVFLSATFSDYGQLRVFICDMEGGTVVADWNLVEPWSDVTLTIEPENG